MKRGNLAWIYKDPAYSPSDLLCDLYFRGYPQNMKSSCSSGLFTTWTTALRTLLRDRIHWASLRVSEERERERERERKRKRERERDMRLNKQECYS